MTDSQTGRDRDSNKVARESERQTGGGWGGAETETGRNRLAETEDNHKQKESERQTGRLTETERREQAGCERDSETDTGTDSQTSSPSSVTGASPRRNIVHVLPWTT